MSEKQGHNTPRDEAQAVYDRLWAAAREMFAVGRVKTDPHLLNRAADKRRGITLVLRPDAEMITRLCAVIDEINATAPGQHLYRPDELHLTVLALINALGELDLDTVPLDRYRAVLDDLLPQVPPLTIHFTGVTASPDSVLVCGCSDGDALNALRDRLRGALTRAGLGDTLDRRYRIVTTHSTILRFQAQPGNLPDLVRFLESARTRDLGAFTAENVEFTFNDWYMSHDVTRVLERYPLGTRKITDLRIEN
jgi:2'-5' RNA ligase